MKLSLQARARDGHLLMNVQLDLPDGALVELVPVNDGDTLDDADRERLRAAPASRQLDSRAAKPSRPKTR